MENNLSSRLIANSHPKIHHHHHILRTVKSFALFVAFVFTSVVITHNYLWNHYARPRPKWISRNLPPRLFDLDPLIDDPKAFKEIFGDQVVFFTDTLGSEKLNFRDICSLESVATFNPEVPLIVVLTNQTTQGFHFMEDATFADLMNNTKNVYLATASIAKLANRTILMDFMQSENLLSARHLDTQMGEFVRFLLLWRLGGVAMDFDVLTFKSLAPIFKQTNFLSGSRDNGIEATLIGFERGHPVLFNLMHAAKTHFIGDFQPSVNYALNDTIKKIFNVTYIKVENQDEYFKILVHLLGPKVLHPFDIQNVSLIAEDDMEQVFESSFGINTRSRQTDPVKVDPNSMTPFAVAARRFCPRTMNHAESLI